MHLQNHKKWQSFYKNKKHNLEKKWKREKEKMNSKSLEKINMLTIWDKILHPKSIKRKDNKFN